MTTLEFMEKQLKKHRLSLAIQEHRKSQEEAINNIKTKIFHYEKVCGILRRESENDKESIGH